MLGPSLFSPAVGALEKYRPEGEMIPDHNGESKTGGAIEITGGWLATNTVIKRKLRGTEGAG